MTILQLGKHRINAEQTLIEIDRRLCAESLATFIREAWPQVEPGQEYVHGWHVDAICEHLEAITDETQFEDGSYYNRLHINVPPGFSKSLILNVFWPSWEWGPRNLPHMRYICCAHELGLAARDSRRMRNLIMSDWYQKRWPHVQLSRDQNQKVNFENSARGFRECAASGAVTGRRGDRFLIDDPLSVTDASSEAERENVKEWFLEAVPTRMNNPRKSAIVMIMQRLHEEDPSGLVLDKDLGWDHLCLPMRFESWRKGMPTKLGFVDPREEEGELLFPERFPEEVVDRLERDMGPYAVSGQFQQSPSPAGGGIIKRDWWQTWDAEKYPPMSYIVASLDTAFTTKQENDQSAMTVWGVFSGDNAQSATGIAPRVGRERTGQNKYRSLAENVSMFDEAVQIKYMTEPQSGGDRPSIMLMYAWAERLEFNDLLAKVIKTCKDFKVDRLLIEAKANGISISQELRRTLGFEDFGIQLINPGAMDKMARLYSVQHLFSEGLVYAPDRSFADMVITQTAQFPKAKHDDVVDTLSQGLRHLRDIGILVRPTEWTARIEESMRFKGNAAMKPLYGAV